MREGWGGWRSGRKGAALERVGRKKVSICGLTGGEWEDVCGHFEREQL